MKIVLYSTHCPRCMVLEKKLKQKNIPYEEVTDPEIIKKTGYLSVPMLFVDGAFMDFEQATRWVNQYEN